MDATLLRSADAAVAVRSTTTAPPPRPRLHRPSTLPLPSSCACGPLRAYAAPAAPAPAAHNNGVYTVGDFMTKRPNLHVVTPATSVDEALETLVQHKISGFPVVDDTGKLVSAHQNFTLFNLFLLTLCNFYSQNSYAYKSTTLGFSQGEMIYC
jgi:CBS domain-containing protein